MSDLFDQAQLEMLKAAFATCDTTKTGQIEGSKMETLFISMGQDFDPDELQDMLEEYGDDDGKLNFDGFCAIASKFLEDEDADALQQELKEAFRLYDKNGEGSISTKILKEILKALDDKLTSEDLDGMIEEIDTDGSGTVDFDEFMEMMTGWLDQIHILHFTVSFQNTKLPLQT